MRGRKAATKRRGEARHWLYRAGEGAVRAIFVYCSFSNS
jgi:hypothetical protein